MALNNTQSFLSFANFRFIIKFGLKQGIQYTGQRSLPLRADLFQSSYLLSTYIVVSLLRVQLVSPRNKFWLTLTFGYGLSRELTNFKRLVYNSITTSSSKTSSLQNIHPNYLIILCPYSLDDISILKSVVNSSSPLSIIVPTLFCGFISWPISTSIVWVLVLILSATPWLSAETARSSASPVSLLLSNQLRG